MNLNNNALIVNTNHQALTGFNTSDSHLTSLGSASCLSTNIPQNMRSYLPDKLQIVKPLEGSQTLQHWQQLARPNLGCLIEPRPGIYIKGKDPNIDSQSSCSSTSCSTVSSVENSNNFDAIALNMNKKSSPITDENVNINDIDDQFNASYIEYDDDYVNDVNYYQTVKTENNISTAPTSLLYALPSSSSSSYISNNVNSNEKLLLAKLLDSQEINEKPVKTQNITTNTTTTLTTVNSTITNTTHSITYLDEIKNLSKKFYSTPLHSDCLKITNKYKFKNLDLFSKLNDLNLLDNIKIKLNSDTTTTAKNVQIPDTPPCSPINEQIMQDEENDGDNEIENLCKYEPNNANKMVTPPTSPIIMNNDKNNSEESPKIKLLEKNFVSEIIERLSIFSFKPIDTNPESTPPQTVSRVDKSALIKPLALHANNTDTLITPTPTPITPTMPSTSKFEVSNKIPETPPPSPTAHLRTSPTPSLPINDEFMSKLDENQLKNSAFIKLSTLNPLINKSVDLSKLLGSLTSLKRSNKRFET